jgi:hypothetical protein
MTVRRRLVIALAACGAGAVGVATMATGAAFATTDRVPLAPLVASWPAAYDVSGQKSEPLYTEQIDITRSGDAFDVRIDVLAQGDAALGTQHDVIEVGPDGTVAWVSGCEKSSDLCADDTELRGFLATAALLGLARSDRLPESGTARTVHGNPVICVDDAALHPDAAPAHVRLDPCFDRTTGAVLAHWSPDSAAFVGATLAPGATISTLP